MDSRENNPSPCDPALSPTSPTSACNRSRGSTQTQSISVPSLQSTSVYRSYTETLGLCKREPTSHEIGSAEPFLEADQAGLFERLETMMYRGDADRPESHATETPRPLGDLPSKGHLVRFGECADATYAPNWRYRVCRRWRRGPGTDDERRSPPRPHARCWMSPRRPTRELPRVRVGRYKSR